ncbi:MAG: sugar transferase [Ilumatobacter sp.]
MAGRTMDSNTMEADRKPLPASDLGAEGDTTEASKGAAFPAPDARSLVEPAPAVDASSASSDNRARPRLSPGAIRRRLVFADLAALLIGIAGTFLFQLVVKPVSTERALDQLFLALVTVPVFMLAAVYNKLYRSRANGRPFDEAKNIFRSVATGMSWLLLVALAVETRQLSRLWVAALAVFVAGALLIERRMARSIFTKLRQKGQLHRRIIVVGTDEHAMNLVEAYDRDPALGYTVVGLVGDPVAAGANPSVDVLGPAESVLGQLDKHDAVGVVVSLHSVAADTVNFLTRRLTDEGYHVALSSSLRDIDVTRLRPQTQDGRTMIYVDPTVRGGWRGVANRCFDVALACVILLLSLPLQIGAALAVKFTSTGPVFFRQIRVGLDGSHFEVLKFRTMYLDAEERKAELMAQNEADGPLFKMKNDPRVTPVGRWLRKLSIDELPQLFNVRGGTMSMVGPRPALPSEVEQWDDEVRERLRVPPGLTGMWQVSGRSDSSFETYKRMDLYYVDNWSLAHDLLICAKTVRVVLTGSGAS